jgi:Extensin-like protein C-terminus
VKDYSIVDIGKELQKYGLRIGENPSFGKVGKHSPDSYHYSGKAIDVTDWRPDVAPAFKGGKPISWQQRTGELAYRAKKSGLFTEVLGPGDDAQHKTHVHLALKDKAKATPELMQWVATGRVLTPEGKLTDVMPNLQQSSALPMPQVQPKDDTFIYIPRGKKEGSSTPEDFLSGYIQQSLMGSTPKITSAFNPVEMLTQAFSQTPNYLT